MDNESILNVWPYPNKFVYMVLQTKTKEVSGSVCVRNYNMRADWSELVLFFEICETPKQHVDSWHLAISSTVTYNQDVAIGRSCVCAECDTAQQRHDQYSSFCNCGWKENIDCEHGESQGNEGDTGPCCTRRRDKDNCCYLRPLYTTMERSAKATKCHSGLCWTAEPEQSVNWSRQAGSLNVIHNPSWPQEMKCVFFSVS